MQSGHSWGSSSEFGLRTDILQIGFFVFVKNWDSETRPTCGGRTILLRTKETRKDEFFFGWTEVETLELLLLQLLLNMTTKKREQRVSTENFKDNFERSCKAKS